MKFENVIFAGGGSRCFWQLGFCQGALTEGLDLRASATMVGSTSAGSAIAAAAWLGLAVEGREIFKQLTRDNPRNIHWRNLAPWSGRPILPHQQMYNLAMNRLLESVELEALQKINLHVLMSTYPRRLGGMFGAAFGFLIYGAEKKIVNPVHPQWAAKFGYRPLVGSSSECESKAEFIDLILAGSTVPPVLPGVRYRGRRVLDGGLIDNVPVVLAKDRPGRTLVLLSRQYGRPLPNSETIRYRQPSEKILIDKFDYASPDLLQITYDIGFKDGRAFAGEAE